MPVKFTKRLVSADIFESVGVFDIDGDGVLDLVFGTEWYQGPDFVNRHPIGEIERIHDYYDDFADIPMDINGNGRLDYVTASFFSPALRWRENPGKWDEPWPEHVICEIGASETTRAWDVDGDGDLEIVPNAIGGPLKVHKLVKDNAGRGTGQFSQHTIFDQPQKHGLGFGDITGNGRGDFVMIHGWLEAPDKDPLHTPWIYHPEFELSQGTSVPIIVADVDGDGLGDLIVGEGHGYGLYWLKQSLTNGKRAWTRHEIDPFNSQYHDMQWADIDGDGQCELITGKRYRAHCGRDPGANDDLGIYYFKWNGQSFSKQVISYGPLGVGAGIGLCFELADLRGTGRLDLVAPGKDGLYIFYNEGS